MDIELPHSSGLIDLHLMLMNNLEKYFPEKFIANTLDYPVQLQIGTRSVLDEGTRLTTVEFYFIAKGDQMFLNAYKAYVGIV